MSTQDNTIRLEPELQPIADQLLKTLQLAMEKAVMHVSDPREFRLPAEQDSLESLFAVRFQQLGKEQQARAIARTTKAVSATAQEREARFGELAAINLKSATAVAEQARKFTKANSLSAEQLTQIQRRRVAVIDTGDGEIENR